MAPRALSEPAPIQGHFLMFAGDLIPVLQFFVDSLGRAEALVVYLMMI